MKSIKEKAEEWADMYPSCGMADKSFTKGANYVLEEVEKMLSKVNEYKDGSDHTILYLDIEFLVKQLKK